MKINYNYIKGAVVLILVVFLYGFAEKRNNLRKLERIEVQFILPESLYLTEEAVNKLLIQKNLVATGIDKEKLDLNRVETALNAHEMIESAEVFVTLDGVLKTDIKQRKPIGRIVGSEIYYLDRLGKKMPLSPYYSARVPVVLGVMEEHIEEVYPVLEQIAGDKFLTEHITAISRLKNGLYNLEIRKMDFSLVLGRPERIEEKFNNFKAFYKKALKDELLNTYNVVDLQFGNQVVCTKK
jgi:cell division protein FtsQ